ncbi:MAG: aminotransferase, partial [Actinomycetota bacterium]|nr:aminotransferase [Actinomycetota bacterium]
LLLPYYRFEPDSGLWRHRDGEAAPPASLHDISYSGGEMAFARRPTTLPDGGLTEYLERARQLLADLVDHHPAPIGLPDTTADFEHLRWFAYPDEATPAG